MIQRAFETGFVTLEWVHKKRDGTEVPTGVFINSMTLEGQPVSLPPPFLFSGAIRGLRQHFASATTSITLEDTRTAATPLC